MPINTNLLVAAPMLQDYLVDKDTGMPLVNGIVSLYPDDQRYTEYKNWYYQTGTPGAYTWIPLDNPMHLSSVGTIQDPNGNDVIPFYYPYDEDDQSIPQPYFVTVYSSDENGDPDVLQFTRENFPFVPSGSTGFTNPTLQNYIVNNGYWRNIGTLDCTDVTDQVIAPSQHDGYTNGDIRFIKDTTGANDTITFVEMTETVNDDITPEYGLQYTCNSAQVGETLKCIQYPVSLHVKTLQNVPFSFAMLAQNVAGESNNYLDIYVYQYLGTGAPSQPAPVLLQRITLNNTLQKFVLTGTFPDAADLVLGNGGDDALFILVQFPLAAVSDSIHTKPQIYLSDTVPDNSFQTYDEVNAIISSPRTGDYRTSINTFQPFGWIPANDGSIGNPSSNATTRSNADTWPLYNVIWNGVRNAYAETQDSSGTPTARGASAIDDFNANKRLVLTKNLGRIVAGLNPAFPASVNFTADAGTDILTLATPTTLTVGTPILVFNTGGGLPGGLSADVPYFISVTSLTSTTVMLSTSLDNAYAGVNIDILTNGTGTQTMVNATGVDVGESFHTISIAEMPAHSHEPTGTPDGGTPAFVVDKTTGTISIGGGGTTTSGQPTTAETGGGEPMSTAQPTVYQNVFFKL